MHPTTCSLFIERSGNKHGQLNYSCGKFTAKYFTSQGPDIFLGIF